MQKQKCELCGRVGQNGAKWIICSGSNTRRVHKPCGEQLVAKAPKGVEAKLMPSDELKSEWAEKRREERARQLWAEMCPQLVQIKERLEQSQSENLGSSPAGSSAA